MRMLSLGSAIFAGGLLLAGCSGSAAPTAPVADNAGADFPMPVQVSHGVTTFNPGIQTLHIDAVNLTATVTPKHRYGAFQGDLFYLNINQFAQGFPVEVSSVTINGDLDLELGLDVAHPFPAPTQLTSASAANRADLGVAGRIVLLLGVDTTTKGGTPADPDFVGDYSFTFDTQTVNLQTGLLLNPAGFYAPAGMVAPADLPAGNATHFPFLQLVDEMFDGGSGVVGSRVGISNNANSRGNYDPNAGGWQNGNMGATFDQWTGFGVLHQGQTSRQTAIFDLDAITGTLSLDFAVIASYTDPRGGGSAAVLRSNRIPKNDPGEFAYYMPHGAVDIERITPADIPGFTSSTTGVLQNVEIIDQDTQALIDPEFPGQGGIRLDEVPTASGIEAGFVSSSELGLNNVAGLNQLGLGSGEDPVDFLFSFDNVAGSDGGLDASAVLCYKIVDVQRQADEGTTLNNNNPPTPVPGGQEQTPIVYQILRIDVAP